MALLEGNGMMPMETSKWLEAHSDPLATLYTFSSCITTADLSGDGDFKLIVADLGTGQFNMKLKVYKGVNLLSEHTVIDLPTGVVSFYMDTTEPRIPAIAVASGSNIFVYKNMYPYFKFTLPSLEVNQTEQEVWNQAKNEQINSQTLKEILTGVRKEVGDSKLTSRTLRMLAIDEDSLEPFVIQHREQPLKRETVITCLNILKKSMSDDDAISCLVFGTEHKQIFILDSEAFTIFETIMVPSVPVFMSVAGQYEVDYKIILACRDSNIYIIRRGSKVAKFCARSLSPIVGLLKVAHNICVGCMNDTLNCYSSKGKEIWSIQLPASITAMENMVLADRDFYLVVIALSNSTVLFYCNDCLMDTMSTTDIITGIKFGKFGREDNSLIMTTRGGGLIIKILKRTAQFNIKKTSEFENRDIVKLNIPKKTKLFIDQTMRERENSIVMHKSFQRDLYKLKLDTARLYVKTLESSLNPVSNNIEEPLRLSAQVQGIGPRFKLKIEVQNTSRDRPSMNLLITFQCDALMYFVHNNVINLPLLVPGIQYTFSTFVDCVNSLAISGTIKVFVARPEDPKPIVTAIINMPVSEVGTDL